MKTGSRRPTVRGAGSWPARPRKGGFDRRWGRTYVCLDLPQTAAAVRRHQDQVATALTGRIDDRLIDMFMFHVHRVAGGAGSLRDGFGRAQAGFCVCGHIFMHIGPCLIRHCGDRYRFADQAVQRSRHVEDRQLCTGRGGQRGAMAKRLV